MHKFFLARLDYLQICIMEKSNKGRIHQKITKFNLPRQIVVWWFTHNFPLERTEILFIVAQNVRVFFALTWFQIGFTTKSRWKKCLCKRWYVNWNRVSYLLFLLDKILQNAISYFFQSVKPTHRVQLFRCNKVRWDCWRIVTGCLLLWTDYFPSLWHLQPEKIELVNK